jgi:hypothetical protein
MNKIKFPSKKYRDSLVKFLFVNGYSNRFRSDATTYCDEVNYESWQILGFDPADQDINSYSARDTFDYEWPKDATEIINLIVTAPVVISLTDDYDAKINTKDSVVEVGCQKIPFAKIEELYNLIKG